MHQLRDGRIVFRQPKTPRNRRLMSLPPSCTQVLGQHKQTLETIRRTLGRKVVEDDLVFSQADGSPYLPDTITDAWIKVIRRLGLRGVRLHDARHTHATLMLKANVHPEVVQHRLGHSSITTTIDTYSHMVPEVEKMAALKFDEGLK